MNLLLVDDEPVARAIEAGASLRSELMLLDANLANILAKVQGNAAGAEASIAHLGRYIESVFRRPRKKASRKS
jgi:hypothetical protein